MALLQNKTDGKREKSLEVQGLKGHFGINESKRCILCLSPPITSPKHQNFNKAAPPPSAVSCFCLPRLNSVGSILPAD